jgi:hypothetical protein
MAVLPGVEQKLQLQNYNQVVLNVFSRPAIIIILAFVLEGVRRLIFSGTRTRGWGVVVKEKKITEPLTYNLLKFQNNFYHLIGLFLLSCFGRDFN